MDITYTLALSFAILGAVLSFLGIALRLLDKERRRQRAERLLCIAVIAMFWHVFIYVLIFTGYIRHYPELYNKGIPLYYLIAPCAYYYTLFTLYPSAKISKYWAVHLLPFAFGVVDVIPYVLASREEQVALLEIVVADLQMGFKHSYGFIDQKWHYLVKFMLAFVYMMAQWRLFYLFDPRESRIGAGARYSAITFSIMYSLHLLLQSGLIASILVNEMQGSFILKNTGQLVWVSLFFLLFSIWIFVSVAFRPFVIKRRVRSSIKT